MEGNSVECGQRFMHKNVQQIHVCKGKIVLIAIEMGDRYRGSLYCSIHFLVC